MNLIAVEAPSSGMAGAGKAPKLFDVAIGIVCASDRLEVVADHLIQALAEGFRLLPGASDELVVDGESDVHEHSIRGHVLCVNQMGAIACVYSGPMRLR